MPVTGVWLQSVGSTEIGLTNLARDRLRKRMQDPEWDDRLSIRRKLLAGHSDHQLTSYVSVLTQAVRFGNLFEAENFVDHRAYLAGLDQSA